MNKLKIKLQHCYGIKKLSHEFDFSNFKTTVIYAGNGIMKTSFAKLFDGYVNGFESKDQVFGYEPYERKITDENNTDIDKKGIFVIKSFIDTSYKSDELSTLLVRSELREEYEKALKALSDSKSSVIKILKANTISSDCEKEIVEAFTNYGDNFFEILDKLFEDISKKQYKKYDFKYNDVFGNDVVKKFVEKNKDNLQIYHDKYFEILSNSDDFFSPDGVFGTAQASGIADAISDNAFFSAGHKIYLKNSKTISSSRDFSDLVDEQIRKVLDDPELRKQFDKIDKALRPKNIQPLKEIMEKDKSLLLELLDYDEFQKSYWKSHLSKILEDIRQLNIIYSSKKEEIQKIIIEANNESDEWKSTINTFKRRFVGLPFEIEVSNKKDSVLGLNKPELAIYFVDHDTARKEFVERDFLAQKVLSQGEKRAFYLLNIIFEIQARLIKGQETLFVIDDIADSFDYKNKYAIVEYLKDLSNDENFYSIILTHNFDFFRTIHSRILHGRYRGTHSLIAEKLTDEIKLISAEEKNIITPFESWRQNVSSNEKHLVACIPFVRNLIEFKDGQQSDGYRFLTHTLHRKTQDGAVKATADITIADLQAPFLNVLSDAIFTFTNTNKKIVDVIEEQITAIKGAENSGSIVLEDKVVLAIGIRLKAEEYMWSKVTKQDPINGSQTGILFGRYKQDFKGKEIHKKVIETLESVNIMTPENIHLNSFMYEPILDMGIDDLKSLHDEVCDLTSN